MTQSNPNDSIERRTRGLDDVWQCVRRSKRSMKSLANANRVWSETLAWLYARKRSPEFDEFRDPSRLRGLVKPILGPMTTYLDPSDFGRRLTIGSALQERYTRTSVELAAVRSRVTFRQTG